MSTITITAPDGSKTAHLTGQALRIGDKFRLIGRTTEWTVISAWSTLGGTVPMVTGVNESGTARTSPRVADTIKLN